MENKNFISNISKILNLFIKPIKNTYHLDNKKAIVNKKNDKRFNNHGYSLFFLMGIILKYL